LIVSFEAKVRNWTGGEEE